ncbi:MAG: PD-(D/E)XK nuclease family protein [Candidatus Korarchaeota archaeon]
MKVGVSLLASAVYCERRLLLPPPPLEPEKSLVRGREINELVAIETPAPKEYPDILKKTERQMWFSEGTLSTEYKGITIVGRFDAVLISRRGLRLLIERKVKEGSLPHFPSPSAIFQGMTYVWLHEQNKINVENAEVEIDICSAKFCPIHLVRNKLEFCTKRCSFSRRVKWKYERCIKKDSEPDFRCKKDYLTKLERLISILNGSTKPIEPSPTLCENCKWASVCQKLQ